MQDRYSAFGPESRLPSDLKENHLHAIISGFTVGDTPGVGTFYDFHKRLWLSDNKNLSDTIHPPKVNPQKPKAKEEKAAPVEKVTVEELFHQFQENPPSDMAPCARLWEIFNTFFLQTSVDNNLISLKELALAGDGTPIYTAAQERKIRICNCLEKGIRDCRLPDAVVKKLILDSAHDAMPYYDYCKTNGITPFIIYYLSYPFWIIFTFHGLFDR